MRKVFGIIFAGVIAMAQPAFASSDKMQIASWQSRMETALLNYKQGNYESAFQDLLKFAKAGDKYCQYLVSTMYLQGQGTTMDSMEGYVWLNVALEQDRTSWRQLLETLDNNVDDSFRDTASPIIADYIARYGVDAQKMVCRNERPTGSSRRRMNCTKVQVIRGFFYVDEESGLL